MAEDAEVSYNSGARLYRVIQGVVAKLASSDPLFKGVAISVGATEDSLEHFRAVLAVRKLFERVFRDIEDSSLNDEHKKRHSSDVKNVQPAFSYNGLAKLWEHAQKGVLSSERIERVYYVGSALHGALAPNVIIATELELVTTSFKEFLAELETADLPEHTLSKLKSQIALIIFDLENSDLFGPDEVLDDIVAVVGQVMVGTSKADREQNKEFFAELGKLLGSAVELMNKATKTGKSLEYIAEKYQMIEGFFDKLN